MAAIHKLTVLRVRSAVRPGLYSDGGGLYLQISKFGTKAWVFRYMRNGRARKMGLGPLDVVSLSDARQRAVEVRRQLLDGRDPIETRHQERIARKAEEGRSATFGECAERYVAAHEQGWRNPKHRAQWRSTLTAYVYPVIGALPVAAVDTALVLQIVEPLWTSKPETAGRVRGRIEAILDWAKARGLRSGDNPARWQGHLDQLLPRRSKVAPVRHRPALPYGDIPAFMTEVRSRQGVTARALEFLSLTVARTSAVIGATWDEVDLGTRVWIVDPSRVGTKIVGEDPKPRRVPLSARAVEILSALPREEGNPHIFIGGVQGRGLSNMAMLELMRELRPGFVPHGLRSSFKDWAAETTHYPNEVSEAALWHTVSNKVEAAYRRGDLFLKRVRLMNEWARFCERPPHATGAILKLAES